MWVMFMTSKQIYLIIATSQDRVKSHVAFFHVLSNQKGVKIIDDAMPKHVHYHQI